VEKIELRINGVVVYESGAVPPPPPVEPKPPVEPPLDTPNPFIAWRAQGLDLDYIAMWRLGHGLSAEELEQAYEAGYPRPGTPSAGGGGGDPRMGFVLNDLNGLHAYEYLAPDIRYTFHFPEGRGRLVDIFPNSGHEITHVNGEYHPSGVRLPAVGSSITFSVNGHGTNDRIWTSVKLVP
jgi:hypothetical protein